MKTAKALFTLALVGLTTFSSFAKGGNAPEDKIAREEVELRDEIIDRVDDFNMAKYDVMEATVVVHYEVDENGVVTISGVDGDDCLVNAMVESMIEKRKLYTSSLLAQRKYSVQVRFVHL